MKPKRRLGSRVPAIGIIGVLFLLTATSAFPAPGQGKCSGREGDADCVLYQIVRKCIDTSAPDYCSICSSPRTGYCPTQGCEKSTEVWAGTSRLVAMRDLTMCACPQVVHGLAVPLGAVSGIEDPDRPQTIWKFAWDVGVEMMPPADLALIVSSELARTQNQLHVHILPLTPRNLGALEQLPSVSETSLYNVWARAEALAVASGLKSYGVLVHQAPAGADGPAQGWHIHVSDAPLTEAFTRLPECIKASAKK